MGTEGLEPSRITPCASETHAYTNSATCPRNLVLRRGVKPSQIALTYFSSCIPHKVLERRLELLILSELVPKTSAYTNSATPALCVGDVYQFRPLNVMFIS